MLNERLWCKIANPARIEWLRERIANGFETKEREGTVFGPAFRSRDHHSVCALVFCVTNSASGTLVEMMAERGLHLAHTTIMRWVQRYVPEFGRHWARHMRPSGRSWRVDETLLKVRGRWVYLYRAVDRNGDTVDFRLSSKRDVAAAKAFLRKALRTQWRAPISITLDGYAASHRAVREMPDEDKAWKHTKLRLSKYLNNLIEQDHRGIKFRTRPMLGFKNYDCAAITIAGIELLRRIGKNQFALRRLRIKGQTVPAI